MKNFIRKNYFPYFFVADVLIYSFVVWWAYKLLFGGV